MKRVVHYIALYSLLAAAVVLLLLTSSVSPVAITRDGGGTTVTAVGAEPLTSYLFVATAPDGTLTELEGGESFELVLEQPSPTATYFSDRPERDAGTMSIDELIAAVWTPDAPAPNAALVASPDGEQITVAFELTDPVYDSAGDTLTFTATPIGQVSAGLQHLELDAVGDAPEQLGSVELFIDDTFNHCYATIENYSDRTFTLVSTSPPADDRWGTGDPPATLAVGDVANITFRFRSNTSNKTATLVYEGKVGNDDVKLTVSWTCSPDLGGTIASASCGPSDPDWDSTLCKVTFPKGAVEYTIYINSNIRPAFGPPA